MTTKLLHATWCRVLPFSLAMAGLAEPSCKSPGDYGHLTVNLTVAHLTSDQRALIHDIVIQSQVEGNNDPTRVYRVSVTPAQLDKSFAYHFDYIPDPQSGTFAVTAILSDAKSMQLAKQQREATVGPKTQASVSFDFDSTTPSDAPCKATSDPTDLTDGDGGLSLALLWDGDHFLAIYDDKSQGDGDLASVKLDASGKPMSTPIFINASPKVSTLPSIVKDGNGYVVAWQEGELDDSPPVAVDIRRLDADGAPTGNIREIPTMSTEARPVIASAYGKLVLAWMDDKGTAAMPNRVAHVAILKPDDFSFVGAPVSLASPSPPPNAQEEFPSLAMDGSSLAVSWVENKATVYTAHVSDSLAVSAPLSLYTSMAVAQQLAVAPAGSSLFTAWEDLSGDIDKGRERIHGAFSTNTSLGASGYAHEIDTGSANWPRLAWDGTNMAVVYYQYRTFGSQIYMTRLSTNADRIGNVDSQLTDVAGQAKYPEIAFRGADGTGAHFGVGWVSDHTGKQRVYFAPVLCQ